MSAVPVSIESAIDEIRALLGDRLSTSTGVRDHHSKDESWHIPHRPDAVAFPNTTEEVARHRADLRARTARRWSPTAPAPRWKAT